MKKYMFLILVVVLSGCKDRVCQDLGIFAVGGCNEGGLCGVIGIQSSDKGGNFKQGLARFPVVNGVSNVCWEEE